MSTKLLIVDVDALLGTKNTLSYPRCLKSPCSKNQGFQDDLSMTFDNCHMAVIPALDKLAEAGWLFSFWTTRPKRQTFHIISVLRKCGIWQKAQLFSGTSLLLNSANLLDNGGFSADREKIALFEREYGNICDPVWPVVAIESNVSEASILQSYGGRGVVVHVSPRVWLDILVTESEGIDELLVCSQFRDSWDTSVDQAS